MRLEAYVSLSKKPFTSGFASAHRLLRIKEIVAIVKKSVPSTHGQTPSHRPQMLFEELEVLILDA